MTVINPHYDPIKIWHNQDLEDSHIIIVWNGNNHYVGTQYNEKPVCWLRSIENVIHVKKHKSKVPMLPVSIKLEPVDKPDPKTEKPELDIKTHKNISDQKIDENITEKGVDEKSEDSTEKELYTTEDDKTKTQKLTKNVTRKLMTKNVTRKLMMKNMTRKLMMKMETWRLRFLLK